MGGVDHAAPVRFLQTAFEPQDWVAIFLKSYERGGVAQRVGSVSWVQSERFQRWLRMMNSRKYSVFVSVNPNPERVGCRSEAELIELANRRRPMGDPGYQHISYCSPCYRRARWIRLCPVQRYRRQGVVECTARVSHLKKGNSHPEFERAAVLKDFLRKISSISSTFQRS